MPFVQGKCESCGGILTVDPNIKAANCPFCGVAYVVQDSINYYKTTINVDTMHADVINVSDESSSEGRLKAAEAFMKLEKYDKAEAEFKRVTDMAPQDYRGWLGLIEIYTQNYTKRIKSEKEINNLQELAKTVSILTPDNVLTDYEKYITAETSKNKSEIAAVLNLLSLEEEKLTNLEEQEQDYKRIESRYKSLSTKYFNNKAAYVILFIFGFVFIIMGGIMAKNSMPFERFLVFLLFIALLFFVPGIIFLMKNQKLKPDKKAIYGQLQENKRFDSIDYERKRANATLSKLKAEMQEYL